MARLIETQTAPADDHVTVDELIAYRMDALSPEDAARVQDHLLECSECLANTLDLEDFMTAPEDSSEGGRAYETRAAWRAFRARLSSRRPATSALAFAASLLLAVLSLGWALLQSSRVEDLRHRLESTRQPQTEIRIADLFSDTVTRSQTQPPNLELPGDSSFLTLILNFPEAKPGLRVFQVDILDAGGVEVWRGELEMQERGSLQLGLPGGFLAAGEYKIRLHDSSSEPPALLETYRLRLVE